MYDIEENNLTMGNIYSIGAAHGLKSFILRNCTSNQKYLSPDLLSYHLISWKVIRCEY